MSSKVVTAKAVTVTTAGRVVILTDKEKHN
jgi:hypothetical protein